MRLDEEMLEMEERELRKLLPASATLHNKFLVFSRHAKHQEAFLRGKIQRWHSLRPLHFALLIFFPFVSIYAIISSDMSS